MKSFLAILFCALFASGAFGLFLYQSGSGKLSSILGKPSLEEGARLFAFDKKEISKIEITQNGKSNTYTRSLTYWSMERNGESVRADYGKLDQLLFLIETATVQQVIPAPNNETENSAQLTLTTDAGVTISTVLLSQLPRYTGLEEPLAPSFTLQTADGKYYACTSELKEIFPALGPDSLTDHHPFFFHPDYLSEYSYQTDSQTVTVARNLPTADWAITSPLKLRTDPEVVKKLVDNLYDLEATALAPKNAVQAASPSVLSLKSFSPEIPPQQLFLTSENSGYIENQPFSYQFAPEDLSSILPPIDVLRSKKLADIEVGEISSILLQSKKQKAPVTLAILPTPSGAPRWMYQISDDWIPASETGVGSLLTALTQDSVKGFSLDTVGSSLDADKSITIRFKSGENLHFDLIRTAEHTLIQRKGESFAAILSPAHARKFKTEPTVWKDNQLWELSAISLRGIQRQVAGKPVENYSYNFNLEQWKGQIGSQEIGDNFDFVAANAYLNLLETLRVVRWIPASQAIQGIDESLPVVKIIALSQQHSNMGDNAGLITQTLNLYRMPGNQNMVIASLKAGDQGIQYAHLEKKTALRLISSFVYED